jgi:predicted small lipoprotein YifL
MVIDCDTCAVRGPACGDCVVSVLLGGPPARGHEHPARAPGADGPGPAEPVELDGAEQAALAVLAGCGLVPPLRLVPLAERPAPRAGDAPDADREVS